MTHIYTDGSCRINPGAGAFAVIVLNENIITKAYRQETENTTNNREELKAIIWAIEYALNNPNNKYIIYTDSSYAEQSINKWSFNWSLNDWKNSKGFTVENLDLIKTLYYYNNKDFPNFQVVKTKGHVGNIGNELADAAATGNVSKIKKIFSQNNIYFRDEDEN